MLCLSTFGNCCGYYLGASGRGKTTKAHIKTILNECCRFLGSHLFFLHSLILSYMSPHGKTFLATLLVAIFYFYALSFVHLQPNMSTQRYIVFSKGSLSKANYFLFGPYRRAKTWHFVLFLSGFLSRKDIQRFFRIAIKRANFPAHPFDITKTLTMKNLTFPLQR